MPLALVADAFTGILMSMCEYTDKYSLLSFYIAFVAVNSIIPRYLPGIVGASGIDVAILQFYVPFLKVYLINTKSLGDTISIFLYAK